MKGQTAKKVKRIVIIAAALIIFSCVISVRIYCNANLIGSVGAHIMVKSGAADIVKVLPHSYMVKSEVGLDALAEKVGGRLVTDTGIVPEIKVDGETYRCIIYMNEGFYMCNLDKL